MAEAPDDLIEALRAIAIANGLSFFVDRPRVQDLRADDLYRRLQWRNMIEWEYTEAIDEDNLRVFYHVTDWGVFLIGDTNIHEDLSGSIEIALRASAAMLRKRQIAGTSSVRLTAQGNLKNLKPLAGTAAIRLLAQADATIQGQVALSGTASIRLLATGPLARARTFAGTAAIRLLSTGSMQRAKFLSGTSSIAITATGALDVAAGGVTLLQAITDAGRLTGLRLALDPADIASYSGSGNWLDTSGQNNHYAPSTGDPVFNGTPGGLSEDEFWVGDGTTDGWFVETAAQTFAEPFHQNNATFTFMWAVYLNGVTNQSGTVFADSESLASTGRGIRVRWAHDPLDEGLEVILQVNKGSSPAVLLATSVANVFDGVKVTPGWNILGISVNEASGSGGTFFCNGQSETFVPTYSSPSATAAGTQANTVVQATVSANIGPVAAWNVAQGATGMNAVYDQLKVRYGLP